MIILVNLTFNPIWWRKIIVGRNNNIYILLAPQKSTM